MLWIFPIFLTLSIVNSLPQEFNEQALTNDISTQNPDPNISDPSIAEDKCPNTLSDITTNTSPDEEAFTSTSPSVIKKRHHHEYCKQLQDDNLPAGPRTTPSEPVSQNPYKNVRYDSGDDNVCNLYGHMIPVTCGGPELLDIRTEEVNLWWSSYVVNCVPGFRTSTPRRWGFEATIKVARYCCKAYDGSERQLVGMWYYGIDCWKLVPFRQLDRLTSDEFNEFVRRTVERWGEYRPPHR